MKPHHLKVFPKKPCLVCQTEFQPRSGVHKFCCISCKETYNQNSGSMQIKRQYERISGNWEKYFKRLLSQRHRENLTIDDVLEILKKQNYKCALSGVPLTCLLKQGTKYKTNASFDRIRAGEAYSKDNVQLVCSVVNSWRSDTDLEEFIWYCKQIVQFQEEKE